MSDEDDGDEETAKLGDRQVEGVHNSSMHVLEKQWCEQLKKWLTVPDNDRKEITEHVWEEWIVGL